MKTFNRIATTAFMLAVFPILFFEKFFRAVVSIDPDSSAYTLIKSVVGDDSVLTNKAMEMTLSLKEVWQYISGKEDPVVDLSKVTIPAEITALYKYLYIAGIAVAVGIIIAIVVIGMAIFTKAYKSEIVLTLIGAGCFLTAIIVFKYFAAPFVAGDIDIAKVLVNAIVGDNSSVITALIQGGLSGAVKVNLLQLSTAVIGAMVMMFITAMWNIAYYVTLPKEDKAPKKLQMLLDKPKYND